MRALHGLLRFRINRGARFAHLSGAVAGLLELHEGLLQLLLSLAWLLGAGAYLLLHLPRLLMQ